MASTSFATAKLVQCFAPAVTATAGDVATAEFKSSICNITAQCEPIKITAVCEGMASASFDATIPQATAVLA